MSFRSPVAAWTASLSDLSWTDSRRSRPSSTMSPNAPPAAFVPDVPDSVVTEDGDIVGATYGWKPIDSIPETLMSTTPDLEGAAVGVLGVLGDLHRGLEAALGHDEARHLGGEVVLGGADVAVGVGHRVAGVGHEPAVGIAEGEARD